MLVASPPESRRRDAERWLRAHWPSLVLGSIVLLAFALRVIDVTDNPPGFFTDEAAAGLDARAILETGKDMHGHTLPFFFESLGDYKLPVFIYTLVPFVAVLGLSEFSVRIVVVLFGTLTVATTYLLARELLRREGEVGWRYEAPALIAAALLAVLPWHLHYSRTGFGEMVSLPLMFTLAWWLFTRAHRTGASLIPAALLFGLCFYTYRSAWAVLPPFLLILALLYYRELLERRRETLIAGALFALTLLPLAYHLLTGDDRASQTWIFNVESDKSTFSLFIDQYGSYFTRSFLFDNADNGPILRHYMPGQGVLFWFMLPLLVAGVIQLFQKDRRGLALLVLLLLFPLGGALSDSSPISSRAIIGSEVAVLLCAYGVRALLELVGTVQPRYATAGAAVVCAAIVVVGAVSAATYVNRYFDEYPLLSEGYWGWQGGPKEIMTRYNGLQAEYDDLFMEGFFNAPHVFIPFYTGNDCPKCKLGDTNHYEPDRRQLFAFRIESPELQKIDFRLVDTLLFKNGEPGFVFVEIERLK